MPKSKNHLSSQWVDTPSLVAALAITSRHLLNLKKDGLFKEGHHWRDIRRPNAARATYRWHMERCQEVFKKPPEKR